MTMRFVIDTDTASDDAVALVMALRHADVRVEAITVVAGNVPLAMGVQNALYTVELCESSVPVHAGLDRPLVHPLVTAHDTHGGDGMGDIGLPLHGRRPASERAVEVLVDTFRTADEPLTLVTLGPLTNVAAALRAEPALADGVGRCVVMGGTGKGPGNQSPVAEYNIFVDPEAAAEVVESGIRPTMVGWDVSCESGVIDAEAEARMRALGTPYATYCMDINRRLLVFATETSQLEGFDLADPVAMAVAIDPSLAETEPQRIRVITGTGPDRGRIVTEPGEPNADVVTAVSRPGFLDLLELTLA